MDLARRQRAAITIARILGYLIGVQGRKLTRRHFEELKQELRELAATIKDCQCKTTSCESLSSPPGSFGHQSPS